MEFVENVLFERKATPCGIIPAKPTVYDFGRPVDTSWLRSGCRIRSFRFIVQAISVESSGRNVFNNRVKISASDSLHENFTLSRFRDDRPQRGSHAEPKRENCTHSREDEGTKRFLGPQSRFLNPA